MKLTKQNILSQVSDYQIFNHFLKTFHNKQSPLKEGEHIINPIVLKEQGRLQKTPSFNLTQKNGKWYCKDFAEEWCHGDVFKFVQMLFNTNFKGALKIINDEMGLSLDGDYEVKHDPIVIQAGKMEQIEDNKIYDFHILEKGFDSFEMGFWRQYGDVEKSDLIFYCVKSLKWYANYSNKQERWYEVYRKPGEPIFYYDHGEWGEVYKPYSNKKWDVLGKREEGFLFGYNQLPPSGQTLDITGGQKDVITLYLHGFPAVTMKSEESNVDRYPLLVELLRTDKFEHKRVLYDNDKTGRRNARKIAERWGVTNNTERLPKGFDVSDYYKELIKLQKL